MRSLLRAGSAIALAGCTLLRPAPPSPPPSTPQPNLPAAPAGSVPPPSVAVIGGGGASSSTCNLLQGTPLAYVAARVESATPSPVIAAMNATRVAREVPGIDLLVYGHSHKQMADTTINGVLLMQPGTWATSVAVAHLILGRADTAMPLPRVRIIATNDFHGALEPVADGAGVKRGGADVFAAQIERDVRSCPAPCITLLVDGGDLFQGSAESNLAFGKPVVDLYNALGYDASALGNHEFDWGLDTLRARMRDARFPMLGANIRFADGRDVPWIPDDTLLVRGPLRIGVIGFIGPETYTSIMARNVASLRFDDPAPIVDSLARALRERGANVVIVVAHSGAFCEQDGGADCHGAIIDFAQRLTIPVNAIVSGHTHSLVNTTVRGIPIVQARSSGRAVAMIDLQPEAGAASDSVLHVEVDDVVADSLASVARVDSIVRRATAGVSVLAHREVARLASPMPRNGHQYALGNLIADAQRWAGHADVAAVNNGGIRTGLRAGNVTYGELFALQPFGNTLRKFTVFGAGLREYLERLVDRPSLDDHVSGVTVTYDDARAPGSRLVDVRLADGSPIRDARQYTVVLNDYMATGRDGKELAQRAISSETVPLTDLDALIAYLRSRPKPVAAPAAVRIIQVHP